MATTHSSTDIGGGTPIPKSLNETEGRYLLSIYWLSSRNDTRVRTGELAAELGIEPGSVTEMVTKLSATDLVHHKKYDGVKTTAQGTAIAESLAWRQCVVVSFFDRVLGYEIDGQTAYRIGFSLPFEAIERLERQVDSPREDACHRIRPESGSCFVTACAE
ncbi:metal-dependent transcriptional regulator [Natronobacterium texcoconense]|uniref:Mn-dependent transcriptional regulator, DtxR family n=1 Tax=Natronobacterium texcoconense TaxID=1095778 RepID=A0A1H1HJV8_NATTX|nr:metal-dependent transcriptional regulator [Natronobacterium texcoconense]SDR25671.1 Mn-dependent transcriptional regulator, DtxR family [Natronobacterium texcoconense]